MNDATRVRRAGEKVTLACRALSAAATDLRVAHNEVGLTAVDKAAERLESETERVCEMAEELAKLASNLGRWLPGERTEKPAETVST
jgi:hypothetical protein